MPYPVACLAAVLLVVACAEFPEIDAFPPTSGAAAPALVPLDTLLAQTAASPDTPDLAPRAARLKARAALMRGPVMDPATRARLAAALTTGGT
jgi:hypothetical protein